MCKSLIRLLFCMCLLSNAVAATTTYYDHHSNGWHWYDDPEEEQAIETPKAQEPKVTVSATEQMTEIQKMIKEAKNKAVLYPTEENIANYLAMQNKMMNHSKDFARGWKAVLANRPDLNFQVSHPTSQLGRQVYLDNKSQAQAQAVKTFFQDKGLYFFFRSTCPYCQRFAPILKHFADQNNITVIPISLDGIGLPDFPNFKTDNGQAQKFQVTVEPSLFVVDPRAGKAMPVGYGLMSEQALTQRIYELATQFKGEF